MYASGTFWSIATFKNQLFLVIDDLSSWGKVIFPWIHTESMRAGSSTVQSDGMARVPMWRYCTTTQSPSASRCQEGVPLPKHGDGHKGAQHMFLLFCCEIYWGKNGYELDDLCVNCAAFERPAQSGEGAAEVDERDQPLPGTSRREVCRGCEQWMWPQGHDLWPGRQDPCQEWMFSNFLIMKPFHKVILRAYKTIDRHNFFFVIKW